MLHKIKSSLILKKIFSYLNYKIKCNTIVHNKKFQKKLGLNLFDYRIVSGRYKKEENGKTYVYNSYNHIVFEGIYSNGQRNGEGKEYNDQGNLLFEGEYLNGKKWKGIEKEYDEDTGNLIFEYGYLNGIRNGEVKEYNKHNGGLLFSGKYFKWRKKRRKRI